MPETSRFIPIGSLPQTAGGAGPSGTGASRFVPVGGGASGLNIPGLFSQFQGLSQGGGTGSQIARGAGMLGSGLGAINRAGQAWSGLTGGANPISPGISSALGIGGNILGLGSGIYGLTQGNYAAIPGLISSGLGLAGSVGGAMGGAAAGGLAAGLSTAGQVGGTLALPLAGISIGASNWMKKQAKKQKQQTQESGDIRRGLAEAVPNVRKAMEVAQSLDRVNALPPQYQIAALQQAREHLQKGVEDLSVDFSRFISTGGQGGKASLVGKVPTGDAEALAAAAWPDVVAGLLRVQDALAQRGVALPATEVGPLTNRSPAAMLNFAKSFAGAPAGYRPYDTLTPEALAQVGPGNLEQFFVSQLGQQNPQFAQSAMGQRLAALPSITRPTGANTILQSILPQYLADQQRVLNAEMAGNYLNFNPSDPQAAKRNMNFLSPYTPGGAGYLQSFLPALEEAFQRDAAQRQAAMNWGGVNP